jgi:5'-3' exonuclease
VPARAAREARETQEAREPTQDEREEVAAARGVVWSVVGLLESGVTHMGVATDHVIESFRNDLWPGYKSSAGVPEALLAQFGLVEDALAALGVTVWPMVELEADDALAAAALAASTDPAVEQVVIMTPDKDLAQSVRGSRVVQLDRRREVVTDEDGVIARYGVEPTSIPDWLALVGDSSDGFPGLPGWGAKAAAAVLRRYRHLDQVPEHPWRWEVDVRGAVKLAAVLSDQRPQALLFRRLATLVTDVALFDHVDQLRWRGPRPELEDMAGRLRAPGLVARVSALAARRDGS